MKNLGLILLVEDDALLAGMMEEALRLHDPRWEIKTVQAPEEALICLRHEPVRMILTECVMASGRENYSFLAVLAGWDPPVPVIVLSEAAHPDKSLFPPGLRILTKPLQLDALLWATDDVMRFRQESVLNGIALDQLLQMFGWNRKSCTVTVSCGFHTGVIYVENGEVIHAQNGLVQGSRAVFDLLMLPRCTIRISDLQDIQPHMRANIQHLLMEWCVMRDELEVV
jgi:CheY-like chemotaxis protein